MQQNDNDLILDKKTAEEFKDIAVKHSALQQQLDALDEKKNALKEEVIERATKLWGENYKSVKQSGVSVGFTVRRSYSTTNPDFLVSKPNSPAITKYVKEHGLLPDNTAVDKVSVSALVKISEDKNDKEE